MSHIIQTQDLSKILGKRLVVSQVNMHVKQGEVYGIVGPNGAGKTSLFHLLSGLWKPSEGEIELFGERITQKSFAHLQKIGSLIGAPRFYERQSGLENLKVHSAYMGNYDERPMLEAAEQFGIGDQLHKPVEGYSAGTRQKLGLVRAMALKPPLLLLDEPSSHLDAAGINELRRWIYFLNQQYGVTVVISSHHLKELEQMVDSIGLLQSGKLVKELSLEAMNEHGSAFLEIQVGSSSQAAHVLENELGISAFQVTSDTTVRLYGQSMETPELLKALLLRDVSVYEVKKQQDTLEDYVLQFEKEAGRI